MILLAAKVGIEPVVAQRRHADFQLGGTTSTN